MKPQSLRLAGPAILLLAAMLAVVVALVVGGGASPRLTSDPGALVRWGLPAAKLLVNLAAAAMVGALVLALFGLRAGEREFDTALDTASVGAAVLTVASGTTGFLTFLSSFNPQLSIEAEFGQQLGRFLTETELGRVWLITTIAAATITMLAFAVRGWAATLLTGVLSVATLVPMATQGHSGSLANHDAAVMALVLHVVGASVWLGGLLTLVFLRPILREHRLRVLVERYSTLALVAFIVVTVSGIARTMTSLSGWRDLLSAYGAVLAIKVGALVLLGAIGAAHRRRFIARSATGSGVFWVFVLIEFAVMGLASGAAAALARTPSPADATAPALTTAAEILTEAPLPPELTLSRWLTTWDLDLLWAVVAGFAAFFYVAGVRRLRGRGEDWASWHTGAWLGGLLLLMWVTGGPIAAYADYLHSIDMLGRLLLATVVPLLLVLGAPLRLADDAILIRTDDSRGCREWIHAFTRSTVARMLGHPLAGVGLLVLILWGTSATGALRWALADPLAHELRVVLTLASGVLLIRSLRSSTLPRAMRSVVAGLAILTPLALGAWVLLQPGLMIADWFGAMGRVWGLEPMGDQRVAGVIAALGAIPILAAVVILHPRGRV